MIGTGGLSPLTGFMGRDDYTTVVGEMHLASGLPWTIPVTLSLDEEDTKRIGGSASVALTSHDRPVAVLQPTGSRPRWLAREEFARQVMSHQADPGLADELTELTPDTTDDIPLQ